MNARRLLPLLPLPLIAGGCADSDVWFVDEAARRGVDFTYASGYREKPLLPEIVGGGVALVDVDSDGDLDIYFTQGGRHLGGDRAGERPGNALFRNRGDGFFDRAHGSGAEDAGYGMGVAAGDYDGDGDEDLYVTNLGANALLRNDGEGRFENVAAAAGVDDAGFGTAAVFFDADVDGDLDLFLVNYLVWNLATEKDCFARGAPTYCAPTAYDAPAMDRLYRNDGDGTFTDVSADAGLGAAFGNGLGALAEDFNGDGLPDIFVANDRMLDQLWINQGGLRFRDEALARGCAVDASGIAKAGMGVAAEDLDGDGDAELLVVNFETETDSLYRNDGGLFVDVTARAGLAAPSRRHTRFGVAFADFDNDGRLDLYEANGKVDGDPAATPDPFREPNALFLGGLGGPGGEGERGMFRFLPSRLPGGAHVAPATSRGLAVGDVNGDGGLDLVVVNRDAPARLFINVAPERGAAVRINVLDRRGRIALGASVSGSAAGRRHHRAVRAASGYLSSQPAQAHFGVGDARALGDVTVDWPGGVRESFGDLAAGAVYTLREGEAAALSPGAAANE